MAADIHEQLTKYITDAHSIEVQALAQLEGAPDAARTRASSRPCASTARRPSATNSARGCSSTNAMPRRTGSRTW